jgi:hypothetical protein
MGDREDEARCAVKQATNWESEVTDGRSIPGPGSRTRAVGASASAPDPERETPTFAEDLAADRALGIGHAVLRGSLIGFAIVAAIAWVVARLAGFSSTDALGVAAFAGLWGGPGFGGMMGATLAGSRAHD